MRLLFQILVLFSVILYGVMALWSFPLIAANANGLEGFDLRFMGYSVDDARAFLTALNDAGRTHYLTTQAQLDLAYPAILSLTLIIGMLRFGVRLRVFWRILLVLLPFAAGALDYVENALVAQLLSAQPEDVTDAMITQASLVTMAKSMLYALSIALVIVLAAAFAVRRRRNIRRRQAREAKY